MGRPPQPFGKLWDFVDKRGGPDACWLWTGTLLNTGYGQIRMHNKKLSSHRAAYFLARGEDPRTPGGVVCHRCDVRACCNPKHLFLGTHADNIRDAAAKKRHLFGERHHLSKLTVEDVKTIRSSTVPNKALAEQLGVHRETVARVRSGATWRQA